MDEGGGYNKIKFWWRTEERIGCTEERDIKVL
jgi:hypothetical protein